MPDIPEFVDLEPIVSAVRSLRVDLEESTSASPELLDRVETAIRVVESSQLRAAARPAAAGETAMFFTALVRSFPNSGQQDARFYGRYLREDVMSLAPSIGAIDFACRRWRRKSRFVPVIAEMMDEVRVARDEITSTIAFAAGLQAVRARLVAELGQP